MQLEDVGGIDVMRRLVPCTVVERLPVWKDALFCVHVSYKCSGDMNCGLARI